MKIPSQIINQLKENFKTDIAAFEQSHNKNAPVSVRLNPLKPACAFVQAPGAINKQVPWVSNAYYLPERPVFTNDPLFHAGCYYVQEASSMFTEQVLKQTADIGKQLFVLDACAAPGGKSTLLASLLTAKSLLVSNEVISTRVPSLVHNMAKWGCTNTLVSNNDPKDFLRLPAFFDVMLVDAPCSGSGLFRKQEDAIEHWSEENVKHCSLRQQRILHDLLPALKENGILIYSTCSYSKEENEDICDYLCREFSLESMRLKIPAQWGITETLSDKSKAFGYRFFPHLTEGEGFFLACFKNFARNSNPSLRSRYDDKKRGAKNNKLSPQENAALKLLFNTQNFEFINRDSEVIGFHKEIAVQIKTLLSALKIKKMPLHGGQLKGHDFIPHPYAAYLTFLNEVVPRLDVDLQTALMYLKKQNFLPAQTTKGFTLLTYQNQGLGWLKNLGSRINNYYPADWRILKEIS